VRLSRSDARAHAVAHCAADRMVAQYEALYREVAA
jgi:primosomal protein N''